MGSLMNLNPVIPVELFDLSKQSIEFATGSYILSKLYSTLTTNSTLLNILYRRLDISDEEVTFKQYEDAFFVKISTGNPTQQILREMLMWSKGIANGLASTYLENVHLYLKNEVDEVLEAYIINIKYNVFEFPPEHFPTPDEVKDTTKALLWSVASLQNYPKLNVNVKICIELGYAQNAPPNYQPVGLPVVNNDTTALSSRISAIKHDFSVTCTGYHMITVSYLTNIQVAEELYRPRRYVSFLDMDIERSPNHDLKCTICKNYLNISPVLTSDDGKITKCGRCEFRGPLLKNRNTLYESIGAKLRFPCMNEECKDRLAWSEVQRHEKSCKYRRITCPFYNCRDKNVSFVISNDFDHFETSHPGSMHYGSMTLNFKVITHHQSFLKLLVINEVPFIMLIHCLRFGEDGVLFGLFTCDSRLYDYEIRVRSDIDPRRQAIIRDKARLYDENKHCLYCLQNICSLENHKFSKKYPNNQNDKYKYYSNISVVSARMLLETENLMFDINVFPHEDEEQNSIISRNSD